MSTPAESSYAVMSAFWVNNNRDFTSHNAIKYKPELISINSFYLVRMPL